uniref:WD repeat-containing protein 20 isoform X4 n=1 Tax=Ciona intestinalis TaxID=7719 RepID=UPI00089DB6DA|nr:WD repeat-containing protein 20 isoform X4 [Ciona intestinalis]|eukprot:XP_018669722.1 WD repeat-containing protein 20 isoform X4 [Ciona intestinalis]
MSAEGGIRDGNVKVHFNTREGVYKQMPISEYFYPKRVPFTQGPASTSTPVKTSFVKVNDGKEDQDCVCLTVGRELFYFMYKSIKDHSQPLEFLDKRTYKGVAPTCHDINQKSANAESVKVAVGFIAGQVQIIDVGTKQSLQIMNEDRCVEKSKVTCVRWFPNSENTLLSAHISGFMYTYDVSQPCPNVVPQYHSHPDKVGDGYMIHSIKVKSSTSNTNGNGVGTGNPLCRWTMTTDGSGVHNFSFSPCGRFIAIVTQNGYLRILDINTYDLLGCMKSYFGGLLSCCWSPDGRYVVTGGEDDLISVWSFCEKNVIARGRGHKSWVNDVSFDPFCCSIPSDADMKSFYGIPSLSEVFPDVKKSDSVNNNSPGGVEGKVEKHHERLNGDVSVPISAVKRMRTYSNISKFSRLSIGLDSGAPAVCYRFGSVGQDSQLCIWELDETTLCFFNKTVDCGENSLTPSSDSLHANSEPLTESLTHLPEINGAYGVGHNGGSTQHENYLPKEVTTSSRSNSTPHSINSAKIKRSLKHDSEQQITSGKFLTLGPHDRKKANKEHKRNLSLPHFGFKSSSSPSNQGPQKYGFQHRKHQPTKTIVFGTPRCPKMADTAILEPLVCKKISQGQITCIDFMWDSVVTTCQDGFIQLWKRPNSIQSPLSEGSKPSGTVV